MVGQCFPVVSGQLQDLAAQCGFAEPRTVDEWTLRFDLIERARAMHRRARTRSDGRGPPAVDRRPRARTKGPVGRAAASLLDGDYRVREEGSGRHGPGQGAVAGRVSRPAPARRRPPLRVVTAPSTGGSRAGSRILPTSAGPRCGISSRPSVARRSGWERPTCRGRISGRRGGASRRSRAPKTWCTGCRASQHCEPIGRSRVGPVLQAAGERVVLRRGSDDRGPAVLDSIGPRGRDTSRPRCRRFSAIEHERRWSEFIAADEARSGSGGPRSAGLGRVGRRCSQRVPGRGGRRRGTGEEEPGPPRLARAVRQEPLPTSMRALRPCWAMSPLVVSQMLPAERGVFDVVIFDEASQVTPPEAVPALLRGARAVVAGDSKQLPPTSFFASRRKSRPRSSTKTTSRSTWSRSWIARRRCCPHHSAPGRCRGTTGRVTNG